jgi:RNA polymerase sigma factor (sigma-70 family)
VDYKTSELLKQCDERIRNAYLEEEYRAQKRERTETRKHISLETSMENGHDYISKAENPMDKLLNLEDKAELEKALDKLTDKQRQVFVLYVVEGFTFEEIGVKMGTS